MGDAAGGQPDALLAPDKVWENVPPAVYQILVTVQAAIFACFSPCVGFSAAGQDSYSAPENKRHTGATPPSRRRMLRAGVSCFRKCVFSDKSKFRRRRGDFSYLSSDAFQLHIRGRKDPFQPRAALVSRLFRRKGNENFAVVTAAFSLLPHLPHIIFTRLHPQSLLLCACPNTSPAGISH